MSVLVRCSFLIENGWYVSHDVCVCVLMSCMSFVVVRDLAIFKLVSITYMICNDC